MGLGDMGDLAQLMQACFPPLYERQRIGQNWKQLLLTELHDA
jgi:hypothetical protein